MCRPGQRSCKVVAITHGKDRRHKLAGHVTIMLSSSSRSSLKFFMYASTCLMMKDKFLPLLSRANVLQWLNMNHCNYVNIIIHSHS